VQQDLTDITLVLDRSGSMASIRDDAIGGVTAFIEGQKAAPGRCVFTLVQFDHEYQIVHSAVPIADVPPLTRETFVPRGNTAMLDAIARAVTETGARLAAMPEAERTGKVILAILTDGQENASVEYHRNHGGHARVKAMIDHQREVYGWQVIYLGANQDAVAVGASIGVPQSTSMSFAADNIGQVTNTLSRNVRSYRMGGQSASLAYTDEDRKEATKP
jgi:hypothetical protein